MPLITREKVSHGTWYRRDVEKQREGTDVMWRSRKARPGWSCLEFDCHVFACKSPPEPDTRNQSSLHDSTGTATSPRPCHTRLPPRFLRATSTSWCPSFADRVPQYPKPELLRGSPTIRSVAYNSVSPHGTFPPASFIEPLI